MAVNVVNAGFSTYTPGGSGEAYNLSNFSSYITGWNLASNNLHSNPSALAFVYAPNTYSNNLNDQYGGFALAPGVSASPDGGNFLAVDGDPGYNLAIYQTFTNLTVGAKYVVGFYQAASQQLNFTGSTTETWQVSFTPGDPASGGTAVPTGTVTLGTTSLDGTMMNNPQQGFVPWNYQTLTFTATSATDTLSFLAQGTPTSGAPPVVLIDGISLTQTPEPATLGFVGLGIFGLAVVRRAQKKRV